MPRKLRRAKRRVDVLSDEQRMELECGVDFFGDGRPFESEAHRRAVWERHREMILDEWNAPGRRPVALWEYDFGLEQVGWPRGWAWPAPIASEAEMVFRLPDTAAKERAAIEAAWLRSITVVAANAWAAGDRSHGRGNACDFYGVPGWYFDRHAPQIAAEQERDRREYYARLGRGEGEAA